MSLNDTDGETVIHEIQTHEGVGESTRDLEALYSVQAGKLPVTLTLACRNANSPQTLIEMPVEIFEPEQAPVVKNYENRSADSVLPATDDFYFDHDEIRALFPECPPAEWANPAAEEWWNGFSGMLGDLYAGWDTEVVTSRHGDQIVTGWWTDESLAARWTPTPTAAVAKQQARINPAGDLNIWNEEGEGIHFPSWHWFPWREGDDGFMLDLNDRLELTDYEWEITPAFLWVTEEGIVPHRRPPPNVDIATMLFDWMVYRYQQPPIKREPAAWAMWTLMETRKTECWVDKMTAICTAEKLPESPHLRNDSASSPLGRALWSTVCGQGPRN